MGKFIISVRKNGDFQFNLIAGNGQIILSSQGYGSKEDCRNGISSVVLNSQDESKFEKLTTSDGRFYFNLKSENGKIIGSSTHYASEAGRESGIYSVMNNAKSAEEEIEQ